MTAPTWPGLSLQERVNAEVIMVWNPDDSRLMVSHLAGIVPQTGRALIRPTPGGRGRAAIALDLLLALGKNPQVLDRDNKNHYTKTGLAAASAWMTAGQVTDLVCDRAHGLPHATLTLLADTAVGAKARLWLIWSSADRWPVELVDAMHERGHRVAGTDRHSFQKLIPTRDRYADSPAPPVPAWPRLPTADFPTFRAACRRHLPPAQHERVDAAYLDAARAAQVFASGRCCDSPKAYDSALVAFLRDRQIGPHTDPAAALIALRGTQAGLLRYGVLLRWEPAKCGAEPASRLPGSLTPIRAGALKAGALPVELAAAALSLHLNVAPYDFGCWRLMDVNLDRMVIAAPDVHQSWHPEPLIRQMKQGHRPVGAYNAATSPASSPWPCRTTPGR
jgi:hypothetical protein